MQVASLDHSIWFHAPVDVNDWLLYCVDSPAAEGARGYTRGSVYSASGKLSRKLHARGADSAAFVID